MRGAAGTMPPGRPSWRTRLLLPPLLVAGTALAQGPPPRAPRDEIVGVWVAKRGAERLVFKRNGYLRTCFGPGAKGSASMGAWSRKETGRYLVELTHAVSNDCATEPKLLRKYQDKIVGTATVRRGELALFVSGEFPPDLYVRLPDAAP